MKRPVDTMEVTTKKREDWANKSDSNVHRKSKKARLKKSRSTKQEKQVCTRVRSGWIKLLECRKARSS